MLCVYNAGDPDQLRAAQYIRKCRESRRTKAVKWQRALVAADLISAAIILGSLIF